jgi:signal transduction histidine kinase
MRLRSIRSRIMLLNCGLLLVLMLAYAATAYRQMTSAALGTAEARLKEISHELAVNLTASARTMKKRTATLARDSAIVHYLRDPSSGRGRAVDVLSAGLSANGQRGALGAELRDASGRHVLAVAGSRAPNAAGFGSDILQFIRGSDPVAILPFRADGDSVFYATAARVRADDATLGYVVRWERLDTPPATLVLIGELIGSDARVYLANSRGDVWTDLNRRVAGPPVRLANLNRVSSYRRAQDGRVLAAGVSMRGNPWTVVVEFSEDRLLAGPRSVVRQMAAVGVLLLLAGALVAWLLSGRLTKSIVGLAAAARAISDGDYSHRATVEGVDEVGTLARAFNRMVDGLAAAHRNLHEKVEELAASEAENRETRERLEHVVTSSRAVLYELRVVEGRPRLIWISENAKRELGYGVEEARRPGWWRDAVHPEDREAATALDPGPDGGSLTRLYRLRNAAGQYRWIRDDRRVLRGSGGEVREVVGVLSDVTEHRDLEVAKQAAEAANRTKSEFLSRMSHELRTPLNAILGFGQLLELDVKTEENRESAVQILKAGQHLLALINEVLDIARIESGQMSLSLEPVPVNSVLEESLDLVRLSAAKQSVALRWKKPMGTPFYVRADQQRLKQVLLNLLSNAIKYNRRGGEVTLSCEVLEGERLCISVRDTGYGIAPEKQARLFTPFDRLGADQTGVEGTGLGLALSKGLVEAMGGTLGVESEEGEGSRFWLDLSLAEEPAGSGSKREVRMQETEAPDGPETRHTVLFIEDNLANVRLMERVFQRRPQVRLLTALQGRLGLELAREHQPDLILLDLNLPDVSGDEVLRHLKRDPELREIPVVMISGDAIPSQVQRMLDLGAQGYLTKPFDINELLRLTNEIL